MLCSITIDSGFRVSRFSFFFLLDSYHGQGSQDRNALDPIWDLPVSLMDLDPTSISSGGSSVYPHTKSRSCMDPTFRIRNAGGEPSRPPLSTIERDTCCACCATFLVDTRLRSSSLRRRRVDRISSIARSLRTWNLRGRDVRRRWFRCGHAVRRRRFHAYEVRNDVGRASRAKA